MTKNGWKNGVHVRKNCSYFSEENIRKAKQAKKNVRKMVYAAVKVKNKKAEKMEESDNVAKRERKKKDNQT